MLQLPPPPQAPEKPKAEKPRPQAPTPGSFALELPGMAPPGAKPRSKGKRDEPAWKAGTRALRKQRQKGEKGKGRLKGHLVPLQSRIGAKETAGFREKTQVIWDKPHRDAATVVNHAPEDRNLPYGDMQATAWLAGLISPGLTGVMEDISLSGSRGVVLALVAITTLWLLLRKRWQDQCSCSWPMEPAR